MTAQAAAEEMSLEQAHRFVTGKLFAVSCFDGTHAIGRIYGDGSVIGTFQFRGTGPERSVRLPAGTLKVKGEAVCASLKDMPFEPCFKLKRTSDHSSAARCWASTPPIAISPRHLDREADFARMDGRSTEGPLRLHPCTAGVSRAMLIAHFIVDAVEKDVEGSSHRLDDRSTVERRPSGRGDSSYVAQLSSHSGVILGCSASWLSLQCHDAVGTSEQLSARTDQRGGTVPAGGPSDVVARVVTEQMETILGQSLVIENGRRRGGTIRERTRRGSASRWIHVAGGQHGIACVSACAFP